YVVQLYRYENCFVGRKIVGRKIESFNLIGFLVGLKQLGKSIKSLYAWKEFAMNLSNTITLSHVD
ncbi:hypothetical protein BD408DRAFT_347271, partial [Parasitella parasitica]